MYLASLPDSRDELVTCNDFVKQDSHPLLQLVFGSIQTPCSWVSRSPLLEEWCLRRVVLQSTLVDSDMALQLNVQ